jgi:selT/selW/selH-like putative selenoprotein
VSGAEIELIRSTGGAFEISRDGDLIFSKHREGRFPDSSEILEKLGN